MSKHAPWLLSRTEVFRIRVRYLGLRGLTTLWITASSFYTPIKMLRQFCRRTVMLAFTICIVVSLGCFRSFFLILCQDVWLFLQHADIAGVPDSVCVLHFVVGDFSQSKSTMFYVISFFTFERLFSDPYPRSFPSLQFSSDTPSAFQT